MPPTLRKRKIAAPTPSNPRLADLIQPTSSSVTPKTGGVPFKDDDPFYANFDDSSSDSDVSSVASDYGRARNGKRMKLTKKAKPSKRSPQPAPATPDLSDGDYPASGDDSTESDPVHFAGVNASRGEFSIRDGRLAMPLIKGGKRGVIDLVKLSRYLGVNITITPFSRTVGPLVRRTASKTTTKSPTQPTSLLTVPKEIRLKIYRELFVTQTGFNFASPINFTRTSQLFRVCREINDEAPPILYGENSFHFERSYRSRGPFYAASQKEIGYKDVRRFFKMIGPTNISYIKYVSFHLHDAYAWNTRYVKSDADRRYVNDAVLFDIFQMIAANTILNKLAVKFDGRASVKSHDRLFLRSFTLMKCYDFYRARFSRVDGKIVDKLDAVVIVKRPNAKEINAERIKEPYMAISAVVVKKAPVAE
jgi:hypothetical protein